MATSQVWTLLLHLASLIQLIPFNLMAEAVGTMFVGECHFATLTWKQAVPKNHSQKHVCAVLATVIDKVTLVEATLCQSSFTKWLLNPAVFAMWGAALASVFIATNFANAGSKQSKKVVGKRTHTGGQRKRPGSRLRRERKSLEMCRVSKLWFWVTFACTVLSCLLGGLHKVDDDSTIYAMPRTYSIRDTALLHRKDAGSAVSLGLPSSSRDLSPHLYTSWDLSIVLSPDHVDFAHHKHTNALALYSSDRIAASFFSPITANHSVLNSPATDFCPWSAGRPASKAVALYTGSSVAPTALVGSRLIIHSDISIISKLSTFLNNTTSFLALGNTLSNVPSRIKTAVGGYDQVRYATFCRNAVCLPV